MSSAATKFPLINLNFSLLLWMRRDTSTAHSPPSTWWIARSGFLPSSSFCFLSNFSRSRNSALSQSWLPSTSTLVNILLKSRRDLAQAGCVGAIIFLPMETHSVSAYLSGCKCAGLTAPHPSQVFGSRAIFKSGETCTGMHAHWHFSFLTTLFLIRDSFLTIWTPLCIVDIDRKTGGDVKVGEKGKGIKI